MSENGSGPGESPRWLTKLFGLYFAVLLLPLLYLSLKKKSD
jgi:hypothetical protein